MSNRPDPKPLENHLQRISRRFISIEDRVNTAFRDHFYNVSIHLVQLVKQKDNIFNHKLFQVLQLAGSYADDIKVNAPNEFDVLVLLKFPNPTPVCSVVPGYVTINMNDGMNKWMQWIQGNQEKYKRFIDSEGYLIQDEILGWLRNLLKEILNEHGNIFQINGAVYRVKQTNNGPAVTLAINVLHSSCGYLGDFSIDFVPALQFQSNCVWLADEELRTRVPRFWNAIPKPNKTQLHKNKQWICSYAEIERDEMKNFNRMKPLIRLFKKIRDKAELTKLKSYYIKTIFLHRHRHESPEYRRAYWNASLAVRFMDMFDVILDHLETRTLWSLWHHDYNLLAALDDAQIDDMYLKLKKIREKINKYLVDCNLKKTKDTINGNLSDESMIFYEQILTKDEIRAMLREDIVPEALILESEVADRREERRLQMVARQEAEYQQLQYQAELEDQREERRLRMEERQEAEMQYQAQLEEHENRLREAERRRAEQWCTIL